MRRSGKKRFYKKRNESFRRIALERVRILFDEAKKAFRMHPERSKRYVQIARTVAMKCNLSMPKELKARYCKKCGEYLVPGENSRIRLDSEKNNLVITCKKCGFVRRRPYKPYKKDG